MLGVNFGEMVLLVPSFEPAGWKLSYEELVLSLITPKDKIANPGTDGWVVRATSAGTMTVCREMDRILCTKDQPCPRIPTMDFHIAMIVRL